MLTYILYLFSGMSVHNSSLPNGVSPFQMTFIPNTVSLGTSPKKRRLEESIDMKENKGMNQGVAHAWFLRISVSKSNSIGLFYISSIAVCLLCVMVVSDIIVQVL